MKQNRTRRLLLMGGSGLAMVGTGRAETASQSDTERANIKLVQDFISAFQDPKADFAALLDQYLAPNASVRWADSQPAVYGPKAALLQLLASYPKDATVSITIRDIFAHGPLVSTYRVDSLSMPGKKTLTASVAGVHIIREGKLVEYCDYIIP